MGMRTLVLLSNDRCSEWEHDRELGRKIAAGMNDVNDREWDSRANLNYGRVVECTHADNQTLAVIDCLRFTPIGYGLWSHSETVDQRHIKLLRDAADRLGYRLVKKTERRLTPLELPQ